MDNDLKIHGHTLVWESQSIPWLNNAKISESDLTPSNPGLTEAGTYTNMNDYINVVLTHFSKLNKRSTQNIISWDVVKKAMLKNAFDKANKNNGTSENAYDPSASSLAPNRQLSRNGFGVNKSFIN
ncbi:endo-1,4-beta-xylanase [Paenibacillus sp. MCAF9]|uniref:endo-1,4-beta-xylanase n=1 Tax=Paenibacillus sp. MCAF9 TaxID=3233046 RepID=UPI003F95E60A